MPRSDLRQLFGQRDDSFIRIKRGSVLELFHLRGDCPGDLGIGMPHRNGQDTAKKIEILAPLQIPEILHRTAIGHERLLIEIRNRRPKVFFMFADDVGAAVPLGPWGGGHAESLWHTFLVGLNFSRSWRRTRGTASDG